MIFNYIISYIFPVKLNDLEIILDKQSVINEYTDLLKFSHHQLTALGSSVIIEVILENPNTEVYNKTEDNTEGSYKEKECMVTYTIKIKEVFNEVHSENHIISLRIPCEKAYTPLVEMIRNFAEGGNIEPIKGSILILSLYILKCNEFIMTCKKCFKTIKQHFNKKTKLSKETKNIKIHIDFDKKLVWINVNRHLIRYLISRYTIRIYNSLEPIKELISTVNLTSKVRLINTLKESSLPQIQISTTPEFATYGSTTYMIFDWNVIGSSKEYEIKIINVNILILNIEDNKTKLYTCNFKFNKEKIYIPIKIKISDEDVKFNYFDEVIKHISLLNDTRIRLQKELNLFLLHLKILVEAKNTPFKEKHEISDLNKLFHEISGISTNFTDPSQNILKFNCVFQDQSNITRLEKIYENNGIFKGDQKHFPEIHNFFIKKILPSIKAVKNALNEYKSFNKNYRLNEINRRLIQYSRIIYDENNEFFFIITFSIKKIEKLNFICKNYLTVSHSLYKPKSKL